MFIYLFFETGSHVVEAVLSLFYTAREVLMPLDPPALPAKSWGLRYALLQWLREYSCFICLAVNIANTPTDAYSTNMRQTFTLGIFRWLRGMVPNLMEPTV